MSKRDVWQLFCVIDGGHARPAIASAIGALAAVIAVACVSYESRVYLQPQRGNGYKVRTFGTGILDTAVLPLATASALQITGEPIPGGVKFEVSLALERGHRVRFAEPVVRLTCHDMRIQDLPIPRIQESRISSGKGYFVEREPTDELFGKTTARDLGASGDYSYGTYSFLIMSNSCHAAPYILQLPQLFVDGGTMAPPQVTFFAARAREFDVVSPMN